MREREIHNWNQQIITEFRENGGKVGGPFAGRSMLLLHTIGAKSGQPRLNPLVYLDVGPNQYAIFASKGGAPTNPDWYHNLLAHPDVTVEIGTETVPVHARLATGEERDRIWTRQKQVAPSFAEYEQKTSRQIPVIILERQA